MLARPNGRGMFSRFGASPFEALSLGLGAYGLFRGGALLEDNLPLIVTAMAIAGIIVLKKNK